MYRYTIIVNPVEIGKKAEQNLTCYRTTLRGNGYGINDVAMQRLRDESCTQLPHQQPELNHLVCVTYEMGEGDYLFIRLVKASFDQGKSWSIFYDPEHLRVGIRKIIAGGPKEYYFLDHEQLDEIIDALLAHKDKAALRELSRHPSKLPEADDPPPEPEPFPTIKIKF